MKKLTFKIGLVVIGFLLMVSCDQFVPTCTGWEEPKEITAKTYVVIGVLDTEIE